MSGQYLVCELPLNGEPRPLFVLTASNAANAAATGLKRLSVHSLSRGAVVAVWTLGNFPAQFHAQYDGEPLVEDHTATSAKLIVRSLGRPSIKGAGV